MISEENVTRLREALNRTKVSLKEEEKEALEVPRLVTGLEMYKVTKALNGLLELAVNLYEEVIEVKTELAKLKKED